MSSMEVLVATAEREVYRGQATMLIVPGSEGELGILPKHSPLLSGLKSGELIITNGDEVDEVFVSGGYMEVQPDKVTILADTAERASDMDEAEIVAAQRRAEEIVASKNGDTDLAMAEAELAMLTARLRLIRKKHK
ncbi:F0F1 ATP synthase subunit epsilon [Ghiorsea bivora]|uniref:F0F1 ATP synthase subunit epsilon n=1 Tax=Ghiorsea bivora TaxID=1485545 RepID=UPI00056EA8A1|nr:F0F1 ATP synthase subunit epsilon [Ghiorsea bivora]